MILGEKEGECRKMTREEIHTSGQAKQTNVFSERERDGRRERERQREKFANWLSIK